VAVQVAYVRGDTPLRAWVDDETGTVCLSVGPPPGQVVLGLTANGADRLLDAVRRELKVLDPSGFDCDDCLDTGQRWTPVARGAASLSSCHCPAARR
jgi:hypothetical protein